MSTSKRTRSGQRDETNLPNAGRSSAKTRSHGLASNARSPVPTPTTPAAAPRNGSRKAPVVDDQMRLVNTADAAIASLKGVAEAVAAHDVAAEERDRAMPQCQALLRLAAVDCPPLVGLCGAALGDAAIAAPFVTPGKRQKPHGAGPANGTPTPARGSSGRRTPGARTPATPEPSIVASYASASPETTWRCAAHDQDEPWKKIWPQCPHLGPKGCRRLLAEFESCRLDPTGHRAFLQGNGSAKHRWMPVAKLMALCV
jgi:hypothetical protein